MQIETIEKKKDSLKIKVTGETHTLLNLIRENAWKSGAKQASYNIKHPYLSQPEMIVIAANPKKVLESAAQKTEVQAKEFASAFKRAAKK